MDIEHTDEAAGGDFHIVRGADRIAEMAYTRAGDVVTIVHTEVDPSLRGQGVGEQLFDATLAWVRGAGLKLAATCSYARKVISKRTDLGDVLAQK